MSPHTLTFRRTAGGLLVPVDGAGVLASAPGLRGVGEVVAPPDDLPWAANRPSGYTTVVSDYDFSHAPSGSNADAALGGGWNQIWGASMTQFNDPTAPRSPNTGIQWNYPASGAGGDGYGTIYRSLIGVTELYICVAVWHSENFEWNSISNKFIYWENGNFILQSRYFDDFLSLYVGGTGGTTYACNVGSPPNASDFENKWAIVEWQCIRGASGTHRVWLNGVLKSEHIGINLPNSSDGITLDSTWGGGGTHTRAKQRRVDHILVARP